MDIKTLKPKQIAFINAYLKTGNVLTSSKIAGVTEPTAHKWLNAGLREIIEDMQEKMFNERLNKQCTLLDEATDKLAEIIKDPTTSKGTLLNIWKALNESIFKNKQVVEVNKKLDEVRELYQQEENQ